MMKAAIYARYSMERQSAESIEDQFRVCERIAQRERLTIFKRFSDAAVSGGTTSRPGYQELLASARRRTFDVIVAEDSSRLWRNLAEQAPRLAELADLGIHVITQDLDTTQESAEILGSVLGSMASQYRKEIGRRTRRGLEGLARNGKSAGGRSYGYIPASQSGTGRMEIDAEQAKVIRQIFEWRASGWSAAHIASELNQRGVRSPGSSWARETRRQRSWLASAIAGDPVRGIGILNNELYRGRVIWNRTRWIRSAADSSRRRCVQNPQTEWVIRRDERLRIVSEDLWQRVREVQQARAKAVGERVRQGKSRQAASCVGRGGPRYLFSTLIVCGQCTSNFVMTDANFYGCSSYKHGGPAACSNDFRIKRALLEEGLLEGIRQKLLAPEVIEEFRQRVAKRVAAEDRKPAATAGRRGELEREIVNLTDAIARGVLRTSPAIAERLAGAEAELSRLQVGAMPREVATVDRILPRVVDGYRELIADLPNALKRDPAKARAGLRRVLGGQIRVEVDAKEARFMTEKGRTEAAFLRAAGSDIASQTGLVAGACYAMSRRPFQARPGCADHLT